MEVSRNNFWIKLNNAFYEEVPASLCGLFWKSLIAFVCTFINPIQWLVFLWTYIEDKSSETKFSIFDNVSVGFFYIHTFITIISIITLTPEASFVGRYVLVTISLIFILLIVGCIVWLNDKIVDWRFNRRISREGLHFPPLPKEPSIMIESFKAIKSKVCPVITYKY